MQLLITDELEDPFDWLASEEHSEAADFEKATLHKLSLSSEGRLTPAPVMRELYDPFVRTGNPILDMDNASVSCL